MTALAEDRSGNIWVGSHSGLRIFSHGRLMVPPGMPEETLPVIQVIHQMQDGAMMLGTPKGIYILAGSNSRWMTTHDGLACDDVRVILEDRSGDTWVGGYGGLTRIHNKVMTRWTEAEGLPSNNIRAIVQDTAGEIWVGTYDGGIGWLHDGKWVVFNQSSGLYDNGAFQILEDGQERFWISSNRGIYRVSRKQLIDVAEGREKRLDSVAYGRADGMLSMECNGGVWPAGAKDAHGFLWFPTEKGVAIVDPTSVSVDNLPPRVVIESASVEHKLQTADNQVVMRPGQTNLEVQYTALNYSQAGTDFIPLQAGWRRRRLAGGGTQAHGVLYSSATRRLCLPCRCKEQRWNRKPDGQHVASYSGSTVLSPLVVLRSNRPDHIGDLVAALEPPRGTNGKRAGIAAGILPRTHCVPGKRTETHRCGTTRQPWPAHDHHQQPRTLLAQDERQIGR